MRVFPTRALKGDPFLARSAGACPPRSVHGEGQALALRCGVTFFTVTVPDTVARGPVPRDRWRARAMASGFPRDHSLARGTLSHARVACEGPSPTMRVTFFTVTVPATVARGPVPRDRWSVRTLAREFPPRSLHGEGQALALRCGVTFFTVTVPFTVARGPVPRDHSMARETCEGPRPTVKRQRFFHPSRKIYCKKNLTFFCVL